MISYDEWLKELHKATNEINQKASLKTKRKGIAGFRDKFAFYKMALFFAYGYISIIQTMIIFLGITPQAIDNVNGFLKVIGISYKIPVEIASVATIGLIIGLFVFGVLAMSVLGLYKREAEVSTAQSPGFYAIYKILAEQERKNK